MYSEAVYPDWTAKNVQVWWQECFDHYRKTAEYDGIWLGEVLMEPAYISS